MRTDIDLLTLPREQTRSGEKTIGDMAHIYGVSLRTLRFYEDRGLLHPRRQGTARYYAARDRVHLELILKGKRLGFTLTEIHDLIESHTRVAPNAENADLTVSLGREQIAAQIASLEQQRAELDSAIQELRVAQSRLLGDAGEAATSFGRSLDETPLR